MADSELMAEYDLMVEKMMDIIQINIYSCSFIREKDAHGDMWLLRDIREANRALRKNTDPNVVAEILAARALARDHGKTKVMAVVVYVRAKRLPNLTKNDNKNNFLA